MIPFAVALALPAVAAPDTLEVPAVPALPAAATVEAALGAPALRLGDDLARIWLARAGDTVAIYAAIRDPERSAGDELVVSLDMAGDAGDTPQHDDFQWQLRRVIDSSVVHRGRGGRWEPPRGDPAWRLGRDREGGGWVVEAGESAGGWYLVLRLHAAMLAGEEGRPSALAFRVYDGTERGWHAWPPQRLGAHPTEVERAPRHWAPVRVRG